MKKIVFLTALLIALGAAQGFADLYNYLEGQGLDGATVEESSNISSAGRVSEGAITPPDSTIVTMDGTLSEAPVMSVSIEAMFTDNVQTYNIPLSYGFPVSFTGNKEMLNFKLILPYTAREFGPDSDSGLGDISLTTNYLIRFPQLLLDSKLIIKAPTGEIEDADVPLGTGSTDVGFYMNGTWYMDKLIFKGGVGYGYNGEYDKSGIKIKYGDEYIVSGGAEYRFMDNFKAGGLLVYTSRAEDEWDMGSGPNYMAGIDALDLVPSATYHYKKYNVEMTVSARIPLSESWNSDKTDPPGDPDSSVSFGFSASRPF